MKSNVGKDPLRLQAKELDSTLKQLEKQKTRAKLEREKIMVGAEQRKIGEEEEMPKR